MGHTRGFNHIVCNGIRGLRLRRKKIGGGLALNFGRHVQAHGLIREDERTKFGIQGWTHVSMRANVADLSTQLA